MARLLVVEGDAAARAALEGALRRAGHAVVAVATAPEAAGRMGASRVDAVVLGRARRGGGVATLLERCEARGLPVLAGAGGVPDPADPGRLARELAAVVAAARTISMPPAASERGA